MDENPREMNSVCRLCLCDNEDILFPAAKIINSTLTIEHIGQLIGVQLAESEITRYAMCIDCNNKLRAFIAYRSSCLDNDVRFRKLFVETVVGADSSHIAYTNSVKNDENVDNGDDAIDEYEQPTSAETMDTLDIQQEIYEIDESIHIEPSPIDINEHDRGNAKTRNIDSQVEHPDENESSPQTTELPNNRKSTISLTGATSTAAESAALSTEWTYDKELCTLCGKLVTSATNHMATHSTNPKLTCQYCGKKYSRKTSLKQHVKCVHLKRIVRRCEQCNRGFSYVESYTAHMRARHGVGESFECKICNIKFRHIGGLRGHCNRKHNPATNCECSICGMTFQDKHGLKQHHHVHSSEKPFRCRYCPKQFKRSTHCKTHELIHEGVKFPCTLCAKVYSYKTLLNLHMRKCHTPDGGSDDDTANREND